MFIRWMNISLRTLHLIGVAGVGAIFLFDVSVDRTFPYVWLLLASGAGMLTLELLEQPECIKQLRFVATILKLLVLLSWYVTAADVTTLFLVIIISGVVAHSPGKVRYHQVF